MRKTCFEIAFSPKISQKSIVGCFMGGELYKTEPMTYRFGDRSRDCRTSQQACGRHRVAGFISIPLSKTAMQTFPLSALCSKAST
jgi:hypothetical protein